MSQLDRLKSTLLEKSKGRFISSMGEDGTKEWLASPAMDLNRILSGSLYKSIQIGTHTGLVGPEASGKSSFMALLLADAQKKGYLPIIIDAEGAWDREFVTRWGLDPDNIIKMNTLWVDDIMPELAKFIDGYTENKQHFKFENLAIAIDSIGALESKKVVSDGTDKHDVKADQGRLQKDIKRMLKMIVSLVKFNKSIAFSAGHYYGNPTGYGEPEKIGGGKYYRLACDTIVSLKKWPIYENPNAESKAKKGKILGTKIVAATLKNRKYPPFQEATVEIDYQKGVDDMAGLLDVGLDIGLIKQSGAWYSMGDERLGQGLKKSTENLQGHMKESFLQKIEDHLKTTGYSTVNRDLELQEEDKDEEAPNPDQDTTEHDKDTENNDIGKIESSNSTKTKKKPGRPKKSK